MIVTLTGFTPGLEEAIINAASTCYRSQPRDEIFKGLIASGHLTPMEFVSYNFKIQGVSRSLLAQLTRKRVGVAFCVESQRYVDYSKNGIGFVIPPSIRDNPEALEAFRVAMDVDYDVYNALRKLGIPAEDARFVYSNAMCTNIAITINHHALMDFCNERLCNKAQWEIRELANRFKSLVTSKSKALGNTLQPKCYRLAKCPEKVSCGTSMPHGS